jgi:hypothetical protein
VDQGRSGFLGAEDGYGSEEDNNAVAAGVFLI